MNAIERIRAGLNGFERSVLDDDMAKPLDFRIGINKCQHLPESPEQV